VLIHDPDEHMAEALDGAYPALARLRAEPEDPMCSPAAFSIVAPTIPGGQHRETRHAAQWTGKFR